MVHGGKKKKKSGENRIGPVITLKLQAIFCPSDTKAHSFYLTHLTTKLCLLKFHISCPHNVDIL